MTYFILTSGEDGTSIEQVDEYELLKRITPDKDGDTYYGSEIEFLEAIPKNDKGCWYGVSDNAVLVIQGDIVTPMPVVQVTKYKLP